MEKKPEQPERECKNGSRHAQQSWPRIIPVMDVRAGRVVRAIGGQRDEYQRLESALCPRSEPLELADSMRTRFGLNELYAADLDAIGGAEPAWTLFAALRDRGNQLWLDAGVRTIADAERLAEAGIDRIVVGLETVEGPGELRRTSCAWPDHIAFSLDLKSGIPLGNLQSWGTDDPQVIARRAIDMGIERVIVLDLHRVGTGQGTGTEELISRLAARHPNVEFIAGGGVRGPKDLVRLRDCGAAAALVSSALHSGALDHGFQTHVAH
jgi:phosphoribosylformimino-5-aminoimidazole carboxamide ribotide isomerase